VLAPVPELNVYLVVKNRGQFLVLQRKRGFWEFPGGGIEFGETPERAAARECKEETGLAPMVGKLLCCTSAVYEKRKKQKHSIYLVFEGYLIRKGVVKLSGEHIGHRWCSLYELGKLELAKNVKPVLGYLKSR
jgi:8-oxo-dGTP pyrophosphatase MutT (NUDIX family)